MKQYHRIVFGVILFLSSVLSAKADVGFSGRCQDEKGKASDFIFTVSLVPGGLFMVNTLEVLIEEKTSATVVSQWIGISESLRFLIANPFRLDAQGGAAIIGEAVFRYEEEKSPAGLRVRIDEPIEAKLLGLAPASELHLVCE